MTHIINFEQAKLDKQREVLAHSLYDMYATFFEMYLHFWVYPLIAASETVKQRRIVVIR